MTRAGGAAAAAILIAGHLAAQQAGGPVRARTVYEDLQMLTGVLNQLRVNHPDSMDSHALVIAGIRGMLAAMDPHSYVIVYQPLAAEKQRELEAGRLVPVPIAFRFAGGSPIVAGTAPGTLAARSDILPGDELVAIDGEAVTAENEFELEVLLAGRKGSTVQLGFQRHRSDGSRTTVERTVKREKPGEVTAVPTAFMLDDSTGYIRVTTFAAEKVAADLRDALGRLEDRGLRRLVLDLRDNGGGSVTEASDVAATFLPSGDVVYVAEGRKTEMNETVKVKRSFFRREKPYPIAVLVNAGTASASELVAGALQDHDRAVIVGQPTFGKSLLMRPFPLPDGSLLWMVVGKVKTPCGRVVQREYRRITSREYYRLAAADRDTAGRPSCKTDGGRTVYGGGGIYPDVLLPSDSDSPSWAVRVEESLLPLKWASGYVGANGTSLPASLDAFAARPVLPDGALADFQAMASREGVTIPPGDEAERRLSEMLLVVLADAKWGEAGAYWIQALSDPEVAAARQALTRR